MKAGSVNSQISIFPADLLKNSSKSGISGVRNKWGDQKLFKDRFRACHGELIHVSFIKDLKKS